MAGVRQLPSGKWQAWYKKADGMRQWLTMSGPEGRSKSQMLKIGKAFDAESRLRGLQLASPVPIIYVYVISCGNPVTTERALHRRFAALRDHGEWFRLTPDDLEWIRQAYPAQEG